MVDTQKGKVLELSHQVLSPHPFSCRGDQRDLQQGGFPGLARPHSWLLDTAQYADSRAWHPQEPLGQHIVPQPPAQWYVGALDQEWTRGKVVGRAGGVDQVPFNPSIYTLGLYM